MWLNRLNLIILHWIKFLIRDWIKMIKKEGILKSLINIGNDKNKQSEAIKDYKERQSIVIKNLENKIRKKFD